MYLSTWGTLETGRRIASDSKLISQSWHGVSWRWIIYQHLLKKNDFFFPATHLPIVPQLVMGPLSMLSVTRCFLCHPSAGFLQGGHSCCIFLNVTPGSCPEDRISHRPSPASGSYILSKMPLVVVMGSKNPDSLFTKICACGEYWFPPADLNIDKNENEQLILWRSISGCLYIALETTSRFLAYCCLKV